MHYFSGVFKYEYAYYGGSYPKPSGIICRRFDRYNFTFTNNIALNGVSVSGSISSTATFADYDAMVNLVDTADWRNLADDWTLTGSMSQSDGFDTWITGTHPNLTMHKNALTQAFVPLSLSGSTLSNESSPYFMKLLGPTLNSALSGYFNGVLWGTDPTGTTNNYTIENVVEDEDSYVSSFEFVVQQTGGSGSRKETWTMSRLGTNKVQARHNETTRLFSVKIAGDINTVAGGTSPTTKFDDIALRISELDGSYKYSEIQDIAIQTETCLSFTNITAGGVSISPSVTRV